MIKNIVKSSLSLFLTVMMLLCFQVPSFAANNKTNSDAAIYANDEAFINSDAYIKYSDFSKYLNLKYTFIFPGLKVTNRGLNYSNAMVPQGMCFAKNYVLLTACDYYNGNSVIYVLSNTDYTQRKYLTTLVLPNAAHVGGIAYDGTNIWVSNGTKVSGIKYTSIESAVKSGKDSVDANIFTNIPVDTQASTLTYSNDRLWIATFSSKSEGSLISYKTNTSTLTDRKIHKNIPENTQGIAIRDNRMIISISHGRNNSSELRCFNLPMSGDPDSRVLTSTIPLPPMSEAVVIGQTYTYVVFESASAKYHKNLDGKGVGSAPVDRVCAFNTDSLFSNK